MLTINTTLYNVCRSTCTSKYSVLYTTRLVHGHSLLLKTMLQVAALPCKQLPYGILERCCQPEVGILFPMMIMHCLAL